MSGEEARAALDRAQKQLERVQVASRDPKDPEEAVIWAFYAYENCIVAVAELENIQWKKTHVDKVAIARRLYSRGIVTADIGDELEELNELRKDVAYDEPGESLREKDLEDLAIELERFVDEVRSLVEAQEGPREHR